ncbi:hypothetical protein L1277_002637 [Okibacterium sp. HSC-33S16]|uniref:hypothetical protein n=1 Tax=Okibacterium sp. HSC-33S16 TaxID=2910965 RepID=UPI00209F8246|nr:hypothetical protein [Okibacterium sp. HSC-33S16]MCP2032534.1 hypothetical protein [Okibacterium sp. HSC-33S16]
MSDARNFDPRYSPEFQRGYESVGRQIPDDQRERLELRRERTERSRVAPMPVAPAPVRGSGDGRGPTVPDGSPYPADATASVEELFSDADAGEALDEEIDAPLWRNPYLITLAILGVVLTIGGVSLFRWAVDQVYTGQFTGGPGAEARESWLWVQVAWGIAPLLAIAGAFTVLGLFFYLATTWKPRRRDQTEGIDDEFDA